MYDRTEDQRRVGYVEGLLTGREEQKELRVFGLTQVLSDRWESMRKIQRDVEMKKKKKLELFRQPAILLFYAVEVGSAIYLALVLSNQNISTGTFAALFLAVERLLFSGLALGTLIGLIQTSAIDTGYVREFLGFHNYESEESRSKLFPQPMIQGIFLKMLLSHILGRMSQR